MTKAVNPWCFVLHVHPETDLDEAWQILQEKGLTPLYMEEGNEALAKIYIEADERLTTENLLDSFPFIDYVDHEELGSIDWQSQWKNHGLNYYEGYVHIDVPESPSSQWKQLKLLPGAGFGDLSHPTTRLLLMMIKGQVMHKTVVDVGCGSGVLGIYAIASGANDVYAIDIDENALKHSRENVALNVMTEKFTFNQPYDFNPHLEQENEIVILMNMVMSEQKEAWDSLKSLHSQKAICFTSGILIEQKKEYLDLVKEWGWTLLEEKQEEGWLGLRFKTNF